MNISFEIHESHAPLWEREDWRYAILMGGRGNGRSGTASRYAVSMLLGKEYIRGSIMRATREDIRASCWGEIHDRVSEQKIAQAFKITENDMFIERGENSLRAHGFRASSGSLTARLKSLAGYNFVWIEEAEEIGESEFRTLDDTLRTTKGRIRIVLTLNTPPKNHWILRRWFALDPSVQNRFFTPRLKEDAKDTLYIPGTWRENEPNLDVHTKERYKAYQYNNPAYFWQVIEGLSPEEVRGKIYTGWQLIDSIPQEARLIRFGEDYGWYPDPACAVAIYYWNGSYIVDELAYGNGLTNEFLAQEIKKVGNAITVADSAEPKSIAEQNGYGIFVEGAVKGKDSVGYRIKVTAQKKILVTRRSENVWQSYENYAWAEDKDGNPKNEPEHTWSHCFAPETLIHTTKGLKRIDQLIRETGYLYSRDGKVEQFDNVRETKKNTEVVSLTFDDGNTLTVTLDHMILTSSGIWKQAGLLSVSDMIQSSMYDRYNISKSANVFGKSLYQALKQKILLWIHLGEKALFTPRRLDSFAWSYSNSLSYSPQRRRPKQQRHSQFRDETHVGTFKRTCDSREKNEEETMDRKDKTSSKQMAWIKRGAEVSLVAWEEKLGEQRTFLERMCSLPQTIQKTYQAYKGQILWPELRNESKEKEIKGIKRGFRTVTYNMEVKNTHCLMANGVIAHNCMDAVSYAMASLHNNVQDMGSQNAPRQKRNIAV